MGRKYSSFNQEEIRILKENPNTAGVTKSRLSVTLDAKKAILELHQAGWTSRRIVEELGYDPKMVGEQRMKNMVRNVRREAESKLGLHEGYMRTAGTRMNEEEIEQLDCNPASYAKLKNEVIYLRKEVEFLKKISQQVAAACIFGFACLFHQFSLFKIVNFHLWHNVKSLGFHLA